MADYFVTEEGINIPSRASDPGSPAEGTIWHRSDTNEIRFFVDGGTTILGASSVPDNSVTNAKLADMPTLTIKGNNTGGLADPLDLTASEVRIVLGREFDSSVVITPPAFTADVDDYAPTGWQTSFLIRVTPDINNRAISGMEAPFPIRYKEVTINNLSSSNDLRFEHNAGSSVAENRMLLRDNGNRSIRPNESAVFYYDVIQSRYKPLSRIG